MEIFVPYARRMLRELSAALLDVIGPGACPGCGVLGEGLCDCCRQALEPRAAPLCPRCGEPLGLVATKCPAPHDRITGFAVARAAWRYRGCGGQIVRRFKFDADPAALQAMVAACSRAIEPWLRGPGRRAAFVSVPMHPSKRRQRGHDHAARLAEGIARRVGSAYLPDLLRRRVDTLPQGDVRVTNREANVREAFRLAGWQQLSGRALVLVDDVTTSGATARACGRLLRQAGAGPLALLTAAQG